MYTLLRTIEGGSARKGYIFEASVSTVGMRKGYHFLWKVYGRVTFSVKNGILEGVSLDLGERGSLILENFLEYPPLTPPPPPPPAQPSGLARRLKGTKKTHK